MFDQDTINSLWGNTGFQAPPQQQQMQAQMRGYNPPPATHGRGGMLTSLISEGGATGGALGGAALGTAILPGVGTLLGAGIGGAIGGFGGRLAENKVRDNRYGVKDAATEGLISGVTAAGPLKLLKAGKIGVNALKPGVIQGAEKAVSRGGTTALEDAATVPLKTSFQGKLAQTGTDMLTSQYPTLTAPMARATDLKGTVAKLSNMGIVKPEDAERIASKVTGADGIINKAVLTATGGAGRVPTGNINAVAQQAVNDIGLVDTDAKSVMTIVNAQMKRLGNGDAEPAKVLQVMKSLEERIADLKGKGGNAKMVDPVREDKAKALMAVRNELQDQLYTTAGANKNLGAVLTPELRDQLVSLHPNNGSWQNHVDNVIMKSGDIGSLRNSMAPFVNISRAIDAGDINSVTAGGRFGNAIKNGAGIGNIVASGAMDLAADPVARAAGQALRKVGGAMPNIGASGIKAPKPAGIVGRLGAVNAAGAVAGAATQPVSALGMPGQEDGMSDPSGVMGGSPGMSTPSTGMDLTGALTMPQQQASPYSLDNLRADIQRDPEHISDYVNSYKELDAIFNPATSAGPKLNSTQIQQANTASSGIDSLGSISQQLQQNPNLARLNSLPGGSLIHNITGTGGYNAAVLNATDAIGRLRSGGAINADEEARFKQMLPSSFDDQATVQYKLNALNNIFQRFANPQAAGSLDTALTGGYN